MSAQVIVLVASLSLGLLAAGLIRRLGFLRGTLAALCRLGWTLPLILAFFPRVKSEAVPTEVALQPVNVLVDDSDSMRDGASQSPLSFAKDLVTQIETRCKELGCAPKILRLSALDPAVKEGFTPLSKVLEPWLYKVGRENWLLVTDGGDWRPTVDWDPRMRQLGAPLVAGGAARGLIVGFSERYQGNVWVADIDAPPFAFESKPFSVGARLRRSANASDIERVQVQVLDADKVLTSANATFAAGAQTSDISAIVPALGRGQHLLTLRALPTAGERILWDNDKPFSVEVLPNTVGVLHLLGAPSWDGRFLRRYLKAEPKYDLISFFILRDPWDSQAVSERELSLIPFPVERLFKEELPHFRVLVVQNFTLFQFLLPEYQQNLVKFVQDGGGLLFIGGPRALQDGDLNSPLKAILPFDTDNLPPTGGFPLDGDVAGEGADKNGPYYDANAKFSIELAHPDSQERALANVYDDWEEQGEALAALGNMQGIHHVEKMTFKKGAFTPLLTAKTSEGAKIPLAVASYPGKGRALWVFSDSFWRMAMAPSTKVPREAYHDFFQSAMTWLLRQDLKQPLLLRDFAVYPSARNGGSTRWSVSLEGPAARYFSTSADWALSVCGQPVQWRDVLAERTSEREWLLSGALTAALAGGQHCALAVEGRNAAFGSVHAGAVAVFPQIFRDKELDASPQKLEALATLTGARLSMPPEDRAAAVSSWLEAVTGRDGVAVPVQYKTTQDPFWPLKAWWFWALLWLLPLEIIIRKWRDLFGPGGVS